MVNDARRILIVSQYFWPEEFRINELAKELCSLGVDVDVLTCEPSYPGGKVFLAYRKNPNAYSALAGVKIYRVKSLPRGQSQFGMLLSFLAFPLTTSFFGVFGLRKNKYDLIFAFQPSPVFSIIPAIVLSRLWKVPVVAWVQDLWPDILIGLGKLSSSVAIRIIGAVSRSIYAKCDALLVTSIGFKKQLVDRGISSDRITYFPQWVERAFNEDGLASPIDDIVNRDKYRNHFKIVFTGNIGECQDFDSVIAAFTQLRDMPDLVLFVVGSGRAEQHARLLVETEGLEEKIVFLGRFSVEYMPSFFQLADALLLPLAPDFAFENTIPGKTQSYLSAGKLILGMVSGETSTILEESGAAMLTEAGNFEGLASNIRIAAAMSPEDRREKGAAGIRYCKQEFALNTALEKVEIILNDLATKK